MEIKAIKEHIDQSQMRRYQWMIVGICICLNIIDGFDVLVMAFTASAVAKDWGLTGSQIGLLLSSGLFGMGAGSLLIAPWADKIGRKPIILMSLIVTSIGMILSAFAPSPLVLGILRFITGLGIGGILACSNVLTSEYSSAKWRSLAISLQSTGYAIGAAGGGLIAMYLIKDHGWQSVFLFGGVVSAVFIVVVALLLPESLDYLLVKQPQNALPKVQKLAQKLSLPHLQSLPAKPAQQAASKSSFKSLFADGKAESTLCIWIAFFCVMFGFYCILSWTPKLLTGAGMTPDQGITTGVWMNFGSMFGAALIGFLGTKFNIKSVHAVFLFLTAILTITFAQSITYLSLAMVVAFFLGTLANGTVAGLYAITPTLYDTNNRASGVGTAISVGRLGSIVSPLIAGVLLDANWAPVSLFYLNSVVFIVAIFAVLKLRKLQFARQSQQLQKV
ncbi:MFS transporter [Vitreoscilla sp. C1]|uniref:MFS transporter n=1 Tax=Vitreoscilla sp. (strain C1) TaxID=96942 RepID=UPI000CDC84A1|nr:MFS transporter [Vitreoscilla sp. C1]AUZ06118.1 MFS transporter [Vitreoscilla sp. C1]